MIVLTQYNMPVLKETGFVQLLNTQNYALSLRGSVGFEEINVPEQMSAIGINLVDGNTRKRVTRHSLYTHECIYLCSILSFRIKNTIDAKFFFISLLQLNITEANVIIKKITLGSKGVIVFLLLSFSYFPNVNVKD